MQDGSALRSTVDFAAEDADSYNAEREFVLSALGSLWMKNDFDSILKAALSLSEMQRELLIDELVESLSPETGPYSDEEMLAELERRRSEVEQGLVKPIPWEEVRRHLWEDK